MYVRLALLMAFLLGLVTSVHAAYLYDWTGGTNVVGMPDPAGDAAPAQDLLAIWWARDADWIYLRMDLAAPPATTVEYTYGLYADVIPGQGSPANFFDVPDELTGIDYYLSMNFSGSTPYVNYHQWYYGVDFANIPLTPTYYQVTENGGRTLEYRLPVTYVSGDYSFWGAVVQNTGGDTPDTITLDITAETETPEPATLALVGLGLGGLIMKRRRR